MNKLSITFLIGVVTSLLISAALSTPVMAKTIHSERSLYRNILVEEKNGLRCLKFNVRSTKTQQSCMLVDDPQRLVFNYTKMLFSSLLINPNPERILIIGLGGGTMSNTLHQIYPKATITNVEIDPAVIKVARNYFSFFENDHITAVAQDGRIFVKRESIKKQQYDWIILDAFNGDYIPEHLMTQEFLQEAKNLLSDNGVLAANTFSVSDLYNYESATYKSVFGDFFNVRNNRNSNRIILASTKPLPTNDIIAARAIELSEKLSLFDVDITEISRQMTSTATSQDWPEGSPLLTDQYSPANLLNLKN
ncbi:spermidine synthase [Cognaticolwellia beringensis]|uniref:Spermidine synthase n=1 Tax=Cognaticolwellia beringensis TaxID=1967665 RepID=A0A222G7C7_9GAMM|nr:fused MFS/spermidine synthase [Cognaticolwellia beringensis]ASP47513.1 spermidine synthase [Cognaticolwellia beringensis]